MNRVVVSFALDCALTAAGDVIGSSFSGCWNVQNVPQAITFLFTSFMRIIRRLVILLVVILERMQRKSSEDGQVKNSIRPLPVVGVATRYQPKGIR